MIGLTLRIVGRTLLGVELGGEADVITPAVNEALAYLEHRLTHLLAPPLLIPAPRNLRFRRAMRTLNRVVYGIIEQRRRGGAGEPKREDLLSLMLNVRDEETGERMTDTELRDQA